MIYRLIVMLCLSCGASQALSGSPSPQAAQGSTDSAQPAADCPPQMADSAAARRPRYQIENAPPSQLFLHSAKQAEPVAGTWVVQLASLANAADAEREAGRLRAAGLSPVIQTAQVQGKAWHRVRLSGYASAADAHAAAEDVKTKLGYASAWVAKN